MKENLHHSPNSSRTQGQREEVEKHFDLLFVLCGPRGTHPKQNVIGWGSPLSPPLSKQDWTKPSTIIYSKYKITNNSIKQETYKKSFTKESK